MKRTIQLFAQRYENYGYDEGREYWKPKGGHVFEVEIDFDWLMYVEDEVRDGIFAELVAKQSSDYEMFEYREFELAPEISKISFEEFNKVYEAYSFGV